MALTTKGSNFCRILATNESSCQFAPKYKFLASNNEAMLTYLPKVYFFTFSKRDPVTFKLLNCLIFFFNELKEVFE